MSITRKQFETDSWDKEGNLIPKVREKTLTEKVESFFRARQNTGYKLEEVRKVVKGKIHTIRIILIRLIERGLVVKKTPYYIYDLKNNNKAGKKKRNERHVKRRK